MCPVEGIGRAFATHIGGHWWGIGGHWRALVTKMSNREHNALDKPILETHTKHNGKHHDMYSAMPHICSLKKVGKPSDLNII